MKAHNTNYSPLQGADLDKAFSLLAHATQAEENMLFEQARLARSAYTGSKLFVYGFIYLSTYCRNNCSFCLYNASNENAMRYRKDLTTALEIGKRLADDGVHLLDVTLGEDPYFLEERGFNELLEIITKLRDATGLAIMVSPGVLPKPYYSLLRQAGVDWYACYQENHVLDEFTRLRPEQSFDTRVQARTWAKEAGLLVEDGLLTGTGESLKSLEYSLRTFQNAKPNQARIMTYVGHENTIPMHAHDSNLELRAMSLIRLLNPAQLIPASLDIEGLQGLESRLNAGANVVTSIVPEGYGLTGVASGQHDIENKRRSVHAVTQLAATLDMQIATASDYAQWIKQQRIIDSSLGEVSCV